MQSGDEHALVHSLLLLTHEAKVLRDLKLNTLQRQANNSLETVGCFFWNEQSVDFEKLSALCVEDTLIPLLCLCCVLMTTPFVRRWWRRHS